METGFWLIRVRGVLTQFRPQVGVGQYLLVSAFYIRSCFLETVLLM